MTDAQGRGAPALDLVAAARMAALRAGARACARAGVVGLAAVAFAAAGGACAPAASDAPSTAGPSATAGESSSSAPVALTSPVDGVPIDIEAEGFSNVAAFTIRTLDGREITFAVGMLENGAEFPPNHLSEHLAGSTPVRVYFRREGGEDVVYRLEDAEPVP